MQGRVSRYAPTNYTVMQHTALTAVLGRYKL